MSDHSDPEEQAHTEEQSHTEKQTHHDNDSDNKKMELYKVIREFVPDLLNTFPEYKDNIDQGIYDVLAEEYESESATKLYEHCLNVYPERFFDILYQNADIFIKDDVNTEFLPGIEFKDLWKKDITDNTRSIIWKYLQLIMLSIVTSINDGASFGDTAKLFEAINEEEFKNKIEETISNMQSLFQNQNAEDETPLDTSNIDLGSLPNPEDVQNHINGMLDGKLGSLAREIAEETATELDIDFEGATDVNDVFKKMFKNPGKLMSMVKNIGNKLETKIKSGDINESELIKEATDMMSKMKDMPGMGNIEKMLGQFGLPTGKNSKVNMGAFQNHMQQNLKMTQQRERMLNKLKKRQEEKAAQGTQPEQNIQQTGEHEYVFRAGDAPEKSSKRQNNKNKNKKKKKKNKNKK